MGQMRPKKFSTLAHSLAGLGDPSILRGRNSPEFQRPGSHGACAKAPEWRTGMRQAVLTTRQRNSSPKGRSLDSDPAQTLGTQTTRPTPMRRTQLFKEPSNPSEVIAPRLCSEVLRLHGRLVRPSNIKANLTAR